ncbi:MAG: zinc-dependent metalloprotease [Rikenellaceae bacterium]
MYKILLSVIALVCLELSSANATPRSSIWLLRKKTETTKTVSDSTTKAKAQSKYDREFGKSKSCETAMAEGGFMGLHKTKGKVYIELPVENLGREMLIASTISDASDTDLGSIGYKPNDPMHVKFIKEDSIVYMVAVNLLPDYDTDNEPLSRAIARSTMDPVLESYSIRCYNNDSTAVVFDVSNLFIKNYAKLAPVKSGSMGTINMTVTYNSSGSYLEGIKAFKDNVSIKTKLSYTVTADLMKMILLKKDEPFSVGVTRSILMLPEKKMQSRVSDSRVGIFNSMRSSFSSDVDHIASYSVIHRWDLQPTDMEAWKRGELVEPIKPIILYMDDAYPEAWREPTRNGIERWNEAFEKIGFKNVVRVVDYPKDDPEFDPDNLKYSCIRYVPAQIANAMGPSWTDPTTGEIINASVIVYNDISKIINSWRFTQTAQIDPQVRSKKMPQNIIDESIAYVLGHEVGHCLGFMHNMSASAAYPVDSLRSVSFTNEYGTTPSIMDYARFNYVAQPEDKGVKLTPPSLGVYDYFLVKYAYEPIPEANSTQEESKILEQWVDEHAGDPLYRYGRQQILHRYDPSAMEEDLGDDPIKAADYGIKNLKYILAHFNEWMSDEQDPDALVRTERYQALATQYNRYLYNVMGNIGGIYLTEVKAGTEGEVNAAVDKKRQSESVKWVINELKNCDWINDREVTDKFSLRVQLPSIFQYYTALELVATNQDVILSSHIANSPEDAYTLKNWADDMYDGIFESAIKRRKLTSGDRILQSLYTNFLTTTVTKKSQLVKVGGTGAITSSSSAYLPSVDQMAAFGLDESGMVDKHIDLLRDIEDMNGVGYVASTMLDSFGKAGYGWQYRVNLRTIDESKTLFYGETQRIITLLKGAIASSYGEDRTHYQSLLYQIESSLTNP